MVLGERGRFPVGERAGVFSVGQKDLLHASPGPAQAPEDQQFYLPKKAPPLPIGSLFSQCNFHMSGPSLIGTAGGEETYCTLLLTLRPHFTLGPHAGNWRLAESK